ncbi:MAG: NAD(P)H-dependent oxidoreductase subunit E [Polyangiaceae bacterium]|nr:NAD(P)H-dependent oxidoreductase subunit E [Polyangiaceae bacterium]
MGAIISALNALLHERGYLRDEDLRAVAVQEKVPLYRVEGVVSFYPHFRRTPPPKVEVAVCRDVSCRLAGGRDVCTQTKARLEREGVEVREVSCLGRCEIAPAVTVNEHPMSAADLDAVAARVESPPNHGELPQPTNSPRMWASDPYPSAADRYGVLMKAARGEIGAAQVIAELKESGLRGMGGAGFPTGVKWDLVSKEAAQPKYVVCNADESEPGTFKDRVVLEEMPHLVVEGMALAGLVVGAEKGIVFIRHEYVAERIALAREIESARARGALGVDIFGSGRRFDVEIFVSPGGYILGEETALLECLEDKRGEPRNKPPFPGQKGLFEKPTLINNVETFSVVPKIVSGGGAAWKALGVRGAAGLKMISLSGDVERPGVYQVPMGTTIGELVALAGGMKNGKQVLAVAPGGASSNFLRGDAAMDAPLDFKALAERGSMLGSGAVLVIAEGADIVDLAANVVTFFRNESCGKCVPCRVGSQKAVEMLEQATAGRGKKRHLALLPELASTLEQTSICGLGQVAIAPFLSVMKAFPNEVAARFDQE